jgi:hypothetical protein
MAFETDYENLPKLIRDNLSAEQWAEAQYDILHPGTAIPETSRYINVRNGQIHECSAGDRAEAPLLPIHDLSGARGKDSTQGPARRPG